MPHYVNVPDERRFLPRLQGGLQAIGFVTMCGVMATKPNSAPEGAGPQQYMPPSVRQLRAQAVYRLQFGLLGLAAMLLLVGLANIIMDRAKLAERAMPDRTVGIPTASASPTSDPLADIGVIPSPDATKPRPAPAR